MGDEYAGRHCVGGRSTGMQMERQTIILHRELDWKRLKMTETFAIHYNKLVMNILSYQNQYFYPTEEIHAITAASSV